MTASLTEHDVQLESDVPPICEQTWEQPDGSWRPCRRLAALRYLVSCDDGHVVTELACRRCAEMELLYQRVIAAHPELRDHVTCDVNGCGHPATVVAMEPL